MFKLSIDDGCKSDTRVAELAKKYNIETIFYLPVNWHRLAYDKGYRPLTMEEAQNLVDDGFEIGSHTITHRHLTDLPIEDAKIEIEDSKTMLEEMFNIDITRFAPPRGYTNASLNDIVYRNYISQRLTKGEHLVHIHPSSGANGLKPWREAINEKTTELWGHSWEWDKFDMWKEVEEFLRENSRA